MMNIFATQTIVTTIACRRSVYSSFFALVVTALVFGFYSTGARAGEACSQSWGPGQYFDDLSICVSSTLGPQGQFNYRPGNLLDGPKNAWCEGVSGVGLGETITFNIPNAAYPKRFMIRSGYTRSANVFKNNGRPSRLLMRNDAGDSQVVTLVDTRKKQFIAVPWKAGTVNWISFEILAVWPGRKYKDTCITSFSPDFEGF